MLDITNFVKLSTTFPNEFSDNDKRSWYKPLLLSGFFGVIFNSAKSVKIFYFQMSELLNLFSIYEMNAVWPIDCCRLSV